MTEIDGESQDRPVSLWGKLRDHVKENQITEEEEGMLLQSVVLPKIKTNREMIEIPQDKPFIYFTKILTKDEENTSDDFRSLAVSKPSSCLLAATFWYIVAVHFKKSDSTCYRTTLFDHISVHYVSLFTSLKFKQGSRSTVLVRYADLLARALFAVFYCVFPFDRDQFDEEFQKTIKSNIYYWIVGISLADPDISNWGPTRIAKVKLVEDIETSEQRTQRAWDLFTSDYSEYFSNDDTNCLDVDFPTDSLPTSSNHPAMSCSQVRKDLYFIEGQGSSHYWQFGRRSIRPNILSSSRHTSKNKHRNDKPYSTTYKKPCKTPNSSSAASTSSDGLFSLLGAGPLVVHYLSHINKYNNDFISVSELDSPKQTYNAKLMADENTADEHPAPVLNGSVLSKWGFRYPNNCLFSHSGSDNIEPAIAGMWDRIIPTSFCTSTSINNKTCNNNNDGDDDDVGKLSKSTTFAPTLDNTEKTKKQKGPTVKSMFQAIECSRKISTKMRSLSPCKTTTPPPTSPTETLNDSFVSETDSVLWKDQFEEFKRFSAIIERLAPETKPCSNQNTTSVVEAPPQKPRQQKTNKTTEQYINNCGMCDPPNAWVSYSERRHVEKASAERPTRRPSSAGKNSDHRTHSKYLLNSSAFAGRVPRKGVAISWQSQDSEQVNYAAYSRQAEQTAKVLIAEATQELEATDTLIENQLQETQKSLILLAAENKRHAANQKADNIKQNESVITSLTDTLDRVIQSPVLDTSLLPHIKAVSDALQLIDSTVTIVNHDIRQLLVAYAVKLKSGLWKKCRRCRVLYQGDTAAMAAIDRIEDSMQSCQSHIRTPKEKSNQKEDASGGLLRSTLRVELLTEAAPSPSENKNQKSTKNKITSEMSMSTSEFLESKIFEKAGIDLNRIQDLNPSRSACEVLLGHQPPGNAEISRLRKVINYILWHCRTANPTEHEEDLVEVLKCISDGHDVDDLLLQKRARERAKELLLIKTRLLRINPKLKYAVPAVLAAIAIVRYSSLAVKPKGKSFGKIALLGALGLGKISMQSFRRCPTRGATFIKKEITSDGEQPQSLRNAMSIRCKSGLKHKEGTIKSFAAAVKAMEGEATPKSLRSMMSVRFRNARKVSIPVTKSDLSQTDSHKVEIASSKQERTAAVIQTTTVVNSQPQSPTLKPISKSALKVSDSRLKPVVSISFVDDERTPNESKTVINPKEAITEIRFNECMNASSQIEVVDSDDDSPPHSTRSKSPRLLRGSGSSRNMKPELNSRLFGNNSSPRKKGSVRYANSIRVDGSQSSSLRSCLTPKVNQRKPHIVEVAESSSPRVRIPHVSVLAKSEDELAELQIKKLLQFDGSNPTPDNIQIGIEKPVPPPTSSKSSSELQQSSVTDRFLKSPLLKKWKQGSVLSSMTEEPSAKKDRIELFDNLVGTLHRKAPQSKNLKTKSNRTKVTFDKFSSIDGYVVWSETAIAVGSSSEELIERVHENRRRRKARSTYTT